jgi:hypothetical protein
MVTPTSGPYYIPNGSTLTIYDKVPADFDVNVGGSFSVGGPFSNVIVDLTTTKSEWIGQFTQPNTYHTNLSVIGSGSFDNSGNSYANGNTSIGVNVIGKGTINEYQSHSSGKLEFMHGVAATQTVTDSGYELYGGEKGVVQIDAPSLYHAQTKLGFGEIILEDLKATSYSLKPDLLSLYRGNVLVDQVKLAFMSTPATLQQDNGSGAPSNFGVSQVGGSVVIHADGSSYKDGGVLLAHHA